MTNSKDKSCLKSLLSEPLLLNGEDREAYDELLEGKLMPRCRRASYVDWTG